MLQILVELDFWKFFYSECRLRDKARECGKQCTLISSCYSISQSSVGVKRLLCAAGADQLTAAGLTLSRIHLSNEISLALFVRILTFLYSTQWWLWEFKQISRNIGEFSLEKVLFIHLFEAIQGTLKKIIIMKSIFLAIIAFVLIGKIEAGFRCSIGKIACSSSCVVMGQSSGTCDDEGECW